MANALSAIDKAAGVPPEAGAASSSLLDERIRKRARLRHAGKGKGL